MKVLATGATGEAVARLRARRFGAHLGDLKDPQSLTLAAQHTEATIHTALPHGADAPRADRTTVLTTLNALEGTGKPFIYTSGIRYADARA